MGADPVGMRDRRPPGATAAAVLCALLLALFGLLAWRAAVTKSATFDEPLNTVGAWMIVHRAEWRVHPDHPALWQYWSALPNGPQALHPDTSSPYWNDMLGNLWTRYLWARDTLFHAQGVNADGVLARSRGMMLAVGVALGLLIALWTWRLAGPGGAVVATGFFALDPNFLGHAPLVKNDVALAFSALLLAFSLWRLGRRGTPGRAALAALAFALGFGVKFSALLYLPLAGLLLAIRAALPEPWPVFGWLLDRRGPRLLAAAGLLLVFVGAAWGLVWASYRFRYAPTADPPQARLDTAELLDRMRRDHEEVEGPGAPPWRPGVLVRTVLWADSHRVLPQAWLYGVLYSQEGLERREGYLLGEHRLTGWWYYTPLAILFKTPLATLAALFAAGLAPFVSRLRRRPSAGPPRVGAWTAACLLAPPVLFGAALVTSRVSMGLRHALTLYPFAYVVLGVVAAAPMGVRWSRGRVAAVGLALLLLAVETLAAWPDYIPFFNAPSSRHRLALLGDSNLDWGQDLKGLAAWQREHPGRPLYLAYFGQGDPEHDGLRFIPLPTSVPPESGARWPAPGENAVLAVGATHLQGIYLHDPRLVRFYADLAARPPLQVIGGALYLYEAPGPWPRFKPTAPPG